MQREGSSLPEASFLFHHAIQSMTHMDLVELKRVVILKFVISQVCTYDYPMKIVHFLALDGAIELLQAYLLKDGSFDDGAEGCDDIFLNASPFFLHTDNRQENLIDPAVKGTLNVSSSCSKVNPDTLDGDAKRKMGGPNGSIRNKEKYWHRANNGTCVMTLSRRE
nr:cinnamoyl-CoA reductase 1-like [Tanacetum cinerariifolium]